MSRQVDVSGQTGTKSRIKMSYLNRSCRSFRRTPKGASAVEFAVIAPVFILLVFGMVEYGRMVMVQQVLTNAVREGARRAVSESSDVASVQQAVRDYLTNANVDGGSNQVDVQVTTPLPDSGENVTVDCILPYSLVSWMPTPFFLGSTSMEATATMRRE